MSSRELLELAAKAAGLNIKAERVDSDDAFVCLVVGSKGTREKVDWNPHTDDGDALRLAVKLKLAIRPLEKCVFVESDPETLLGQSQFSELEMYGSDPNAATRRAIVRAAAGIGKEMP